MYERSAKRIEQLGLPAKGKSAVESTDLNKLLLHAKRVSLFACVVKLKECYLLGLKRHSIAVNCPDKQKSV